MTRGPDPIGAVCGVLVIVLGLVLLLSDAGTIELGWGWLTSFTLVAVGGVLFAFGLRR